MGILSLPVMADGCFIYDTSLGKYAESPHQRAIIIHDGTLETLLLWVRYEGSAKELAWVIPLPGIPEESEVLISDSIFIKLHEWTQPNMMRIASYKGESAALDNSPRISSAKLWQRLLTGPYDMQVMRAASIEAFTGWLAESGFEIPAATQTLMDEYVQRGWCFIAFRISLETLSDNEYSGSLPPIQLSFPAEAPVFPLSISRLTSAANNEIELYLLDRHRMICSNVKTEALDPEDLQEILLENQGAGSETSGTQCGCRQATDPLPVYEEVDYQILFRDKIETYHEPVFIVESAESFVTSETVMTGDPFDGFFNTFFLPGTTVWLTRMRTFIRQEEITEDLVFEADPLGDRWLKLYVILEDPGPVAYNALGFLGFIPTLVSRKKRKQYIKYGILFAILFWVAAG